MPTIEERVAFIEGQMSKQSHALIELRDAVRSLNQETRDSVRHLDLDQKMDTRFETLGDRISRQFVWLVGMQVTTMVAIVGALLARG